MVPNPARPGIATNWGGFWLMWAMRLGGGSTLRVASEMPNSGALSNADWKSTVWSLRVSTNGKL